MLVSLTLTWQTRSTHGWKPKTMLSPRLSLLVEILPQQITDAQPMPNYAAIVGLLAVLFYFYTGVAVARGAREIRDQGASFRPPGLRALFLRAG